MNKLIKPTDSTKHYRTRRHERALQKDWVDATIHEPEWTVADPLHPERERRFRSFPGSTERILRVVVVETDDEIRIVTAFFDRNARRP